MGLFSGLHWEWNFFLLWNFQGIKYYFYMDFFVLLTIKKNMCMSNTVFEVLHMKMSCCCCSVTMSCLTLCNCNMPCFPVLHCLLEFAQTHVHWVVDAIQSSHPLSSSSPPVLSLSQHQGLFQWLAVCIGDQNTGVSASASVLPMNIQDLFPLGWTGWISLQSKGLSRVFSNTTIQNHQFFGAELSLWSNSHIHTRLLEKP